MSSLAGGSITSTRKWEVYALGIGFSIIWSSAFVAGKLGIQSSPPLWLLTIRFFIAGALMAVLLRLTGRAFPTRPGDYLTGIGLGLLNNAIYLGLCFYAFHHVTAGMVAMLASLTPLATALLAHPILGERLSARRVAGIGLGVLGAWFVLRGRLDGSGLDDPLWLVIVFVAMCCLSGGTILYRARATGSDPLAMNMIMTLASAVAVLPGALILEDFGAIKWDLNFFLVQAYIICVVSITGLLLWFRLIRLAGAGAASAFHFLNPALALGMAFVVLGEPVAAADLLGLIPIAAGILLVTRAGRPKV
jgi:drug/metabolite transporter (DMT)-like permease